MAAVDKVFATAVAEEGYLEKSLTAYNRKHAIVYEKEAGAGKDNITKYWEDVDKNMQGDLWCQVFVYWLFLMTYGVELARKMLYLTPELWKQGDTWRNFYTPDWSQNFKDNKAYVQSSKVQPGDIVYFKNSQRVHHTGLVLAVERYADGTGLLTTIEGNTSSGPDVNPNGGCVRIKKYSMTKSGINAVAWYGRPNYDLVPDEKRPTVKKGYHDEDHGGNWCAVLQDSLNKLGIKDEDGNSLDTDGHCGTHTTAAIKNFQKKVGLKVTGTCNAETWEAIDHELSVLRVSVPEIPAGKYEYDKVENGYYHLVQFDIWVKG